MSGILAALVGGSGASRTLLLGTRLVVTYTAYGFDQATATGSLTPTELLGTNITRLEYGTNNTLTLKVANTSITNAGWESLNANGTIFSRTSASFSAGVWTWSGVSTNPLTFSVGTTVPVNVA